MEKKSLEGYADQELLLRALVTFVSDRIERSQMLVKSLIRQSISEWITRHKITLKDIKHKEENERENVVSEMIDIFLLKIKHIETNSFKRKELKKDILKIYLHWKKTKRTDPADQIVSEMEELTK